MKFKFNKQDAALAYASEYLEYFPNRGRPFGLKHLGLTFYGITDCLFLYKNQQSLLPIHNDLLSFIFKESCPYLSNEAQLTKVTESLTQRAEEALDLELIELDEAAPFCPPGADNFWHWLCENLTKILALELIGYSGLYILPKDSKVALESLALLGISKKRIIFNTHNYRIKRLILPPRLSGFNLIKHLALTKLLREEILKKTGSLTGSKNLYLQRLGVRKIINEEEVLKTLQAFDFEIKSPEELTFAEQFKYMTNVTCSVMGHGANSTLTLFQKENSCAIELFGNRYVSYNNLHAVKLLNLNYHALVEDLELASCPDKNLNVFDYLMTGYTKDYFVDTEHLQILLENALKN